MDAGLDPSVSISWGGTKLSAPAEATADVETPVYFSAGVETLFGVLTHPPAGTTGTALVALPGRWYGTSVGRNRFSVHLCRRVAVNGLHAFRFDYHGIGESTGSTGRFRIDRPFVEDLDGALACLGRQGIGSYILAGVCFGARTALAAAPSVPGLRGIVLITPPVTDSMGPGGNIDQVIGRISLWKLLRGAVRPWVVREYLTSERKRTYTKYRRALVRAIRRRIQPPRRVEIEEGVYPLSQLFLPPLADLVERRIPVLLIYGTDDDEYADFQKARLGSLGQLLDRAESLIDVVTLPGRVHGIGRVALQEALVDLIGNWVSGLETKATIGGSRNSTVRSGQTGSDGIA
jgi:pimeloyl-ACP methyl ester carboxylesterase